MKKIKQALESWLRGIVSAEVSKIDTSLARERLMIEEHLVALEQAVQNIAEVKENRQLRDHVKQLHGHIAEIEATFRKLHPEAGQ